MSRFARVDADVWRLDQSVEPERRRCLLHAPPFEGLVDAMMSDAKLEAIQWERVPKKDGQREPGRRFIIKVRVRPGRLDRFFNSSSGYRAQFLVGVRLGGRADRYVRDAAMRELASQLEAYYGPVYPKELVERSIAHPRAKVWIHQGLWLRCARRTDRVLRIAAWQGGLESDVDDRRKKARWGMLAPHTESLLLLKGAYFHEGRPLKGRKDPADRARELHELGFT
jgi:hypothetical protein